jgi:hypothetical protein
MVPSVHISNYITRLAASLLLTVLVAYGESIVSQIAESSIHASITASRGAAPSQSTWTYEHGFPLCATYHYVVADGLLDQTSSTIKIVRHGAVIIDTGSRYLLIDYYFNVTGIVVNTLLCFAAMCLICRLHRVPKEPGDCTLCGYDNNAKVSICAECGQLLQATVLDNNVHN